MVIQCVRSSPGIEYDHHSDRRLGLQETCSYAVINRDFTGLVWLVQRTAFRMLTPAQPK